MCNSARRSPAASRSAAMSPVTLRLGHIRWGDAHGPDQTAVEIDVGRGVCSR